MLRILRLKILFVPGAVFGCLCWARQHDIRGAVPEHHPGRQLLGVPAEEKLAERPSSVHQEHHGSFREDILDRPDFQ